MSFLSLNLIHRLLCAKMVCIVFSFSIIFLASFSCQIMLKEAAVRTCTSVVIEPVVLFACHLVCVSVFWWHFLGFPAMRLLLLDYSCNYICSSLSFVGCLIYFESGEHMPYMFYNFNIWGICMSISIFCFFLWFYFLVCLLFCDYLPNIMHRNIKGSGCCYLLPERLFCLFWEAAGVETDHWIHWGTELTQGWVAVFVIFGMLLTNFRS